MALGVSGHRSLAIASTSDPTVRPSPRVSLRAFSNAIASCLFLLTLKIDFSVGFASRQHFPLTTTKSWGPHFAPTTPSRPAGAIPNRSGSDPDSSNVRCAISTSNDDNHDGSEQLPAVTPAFLGSRRSVLSGGVAASVGALWKGDFAVAVAVAAGDPIGNIGEPVISGGPLPLTVGLGTGPPYEQKYVELAINAGYRLFDTAQEYGSEEAIGNALKGAFSSGRLERQDVFVTTKVDIYNMGYEPTIRSVRESFDLLGKLDGGIDLVLIHWPCPFVGKDEPGAIAKYKSLRQQTWEALERLQQDGVAKQIGVSNFGTRHLNELLSYAKVRPAVNQVEVHPYNQRVDLEKLVKSEGIRFEAYSPLGKGVIGLLEDPMLVGIANSKKKSVAAVILRWLLQRGITPIPLSRNEKRIKENLNVFDFELTDVEMRAIASLDRGQFVIMDDETLA